MAHFLVLTANTGYAHMASAVALKEWLEDAGHTVVIDRFLEHSSPIYAQLVALYNGIQRRWPLLHNLYWPLLEFQDLITPGTVLVGRRYFRRLLLQEKPDVLIFNTPYTNRGYTQFARRVLPKLRLVTCCVELDGGYGFSRNWLERQIDLFWAQSRPVADAALAAGMPEDRVEVLGPLLHRRYSQPGLTDRDKQLLRAELGLDPQLPVLVLSTGGAGANNHLRLLSILQPLSGQLQVLALCGRNPASRWSVDAWAHAHPQLKVVSLPFTDRMEALYQLAWAVVARPGGRTAAETLVMQTPTIFNGIGGIMPQEQLTLRYYRRFGLEQTIRRPAELLPLLQRWLEQPAAYKAYRQQLAEARLPMDPVRTVARLSALAAREVVA